MSALITDAFLVTGVTSLVFTTLLLTSLKRTKATFWLAAYLFCVGYIWIYFGLYRVDRLSWAPWLRYTELWMEFLAGPFLYRYTRSLLGFKPSRRFWIRLLPFVPGVAFAAYLFLIQPAARIPAFVLKETDPAYFWDPLLDFLNSVDDLCFFTWAAVSTVFVCKAYFSGRGRKPVALLALLVFYAVGLATLVGFAVGHFWRSDSVLAISVLVNGLNTTYLFLLSHRYPEQTLKHFHDSRKRASASLHSPQSSVARSLLARLAKEVEEDVCYRDPDLTLQSLSARLGVQHHQLSQVLNEQMGTTFRRYINGHRLSEARRLFVEMPKMSILDVAFSVGFNSKSAFNDAFYKATGQTPTEFRRNSRPTS